MKYMNNLKEYRTLNKSLSFFKVLNLFILILLRQSIKNNNYLNFPEKVNHFMSNNIAFNIHSMLNNLQ